MVCLVKSKAESLSLESLSGARNFHPGEVKPQVLNLL